MLVALLVTVFVSLGFWQLRRAEEKRALMSLRQTRAEEAPLRLGPELEELADLRYQPVMATGRYDFEHQFLLDNQIFEGRPGYQVLTPLHLEGALVAVLVNRGWIPLNPDRRQLPALPAPAGPLSISGTLDKFASLGLKLEGAEIPTPTWPAVVQVAEAGPLAERLGYPLLPYQVLLAPAEPGGFERAWRQIDLHPETSQGYAVQWFAFAFTTVALYVWYGFKPRSEPHSS